MPSPEALHEPRDFHGPNNLETERSVDELYEHSDTELFAVWSLYLKVKEETGDER